MRRITSLAALLLLSVYGAEAITIVQSNGPAYQGSSPGTAAFTSNVTKGNLLIVAGGAYSGAGTVSAPTDTLTNAWTLVIQTNTAAGCGGACGAYLYYAIANASGADTVSMAFSATDLALSLAEISGANAVDQKAAANGTSTTAASGNMNTNAANELMFAFIITNDGTVTPVSPFTLVAANSVNTLSESDIVSTTGTYNATATLASSNEWLCVAASFFLASGAGQVGAFLVGP
jgi:hypothetical protein